jgi:hypothetical protein
MAVCEVSERPYPPDRDGDQPRLLWTPRKSTQLHFKSVQKSACVLANLQEGCGDFHALTADPFRATGSATAATIPAAIPLRSFSSRRAGGCCKAAEASL